MWAGDSSHLRNTPVRRGEACLAPCLHFKPKAQTSFSKFTLNIIHFPQVKTAASSKPSWRKGINKTTLKTKQLTRDLGWKNPLDVKLSQLSPVVRTGASLVKAYARATRRSCSGPAVVRRRCKQSINTGLCWGLGRHHPSSPWHSWDCCGENSRQVWESQPTPEVDPTPFPNSLSVNKEDCCQLFSLLLAVHSTKVRWRYLFTSAERSP